MDDKLLIRAYNVGVGDCIYVRIPKARKKGSKVDDFHILIDCGKKGSADLLKVALDHLKNDLPRGRRQEAPRPSARSAMSMRTTSRASIQSGSTTSRSRTSG